MRENTLLSGSGVIGAVYVQTQTSSAPLGEIITDTCFVISPHVSATVEMESSQFSQQTFRHDNTLFLAERLRNIGADWVFGSNFRSRVLTEVAADAVIFKLKWQRVIHCVRSLTFHIASDSWKLSDTLKRKHGLGLQ